MEWLAGERVRAVRRRQVLVRGRGARRTGVYSGLRRDRKTTAYKTPRRKDSLKRSASTLRAGEGAGRTERGAAGPAFRGFLGGLGKDSAKENSHAKRHPQKATRRCQEFPSRTSRDGIPCVSKSTVAPLLLVLVDYVGTRQCPRPRSRRGPCCWRCWPASRPPPSCRPFHPLRLLHFTVRSLLLFLVVR